jgi:hypothetical protein
MIGVFSGADARQISAVQAAGRFKSKSFTEESDISGETEV